MKKHLVIIGVGNILKSDEGIGVHVINIIRERIKSRKLPINVEVVDCGTNGLAVLEALDGANKAIIIDAMLIGEKPGTIKVFSINELLNLRNNFLNNLISLHQFDLINTFKIAELTDTYKLPNEIKIIGVEVGKLDYSLELSNEVKKAIPKIIDLINCEIKKILRERGK